MLLLDFDLTAVPYQENGCDCGVFVCRYAYNLYTMRHQKFTLLGMRETPQFLFRITRGAAFQFDMSDIARIREEIGTLVDNLSPLYLQMKAQEKEAKKKAKRGDENAESGDGSGDTTEAASGKEDVSPEARSETTTMPASDGEGGAPAVEGGGALEGEGGGKTEAAVDEDGDAAMPPSEEKENVANESQSQTSVVEVSAPEKVASAESDDAELTEVRSQDI